MKFYKANEYQPSCDDLYQQYQREIQKLLPDATIEHIGASSIPMAISKGDLDIFVGVDASQFAPAIKTLTTHGFYEKTDTLRTPELCMLESSSDDDVALQVVVKGSEFECFLHFRDKLRRNPLLVQQYNELKLSCSGWPQDEYRLKKSAFVERILRQE
mgnify:CR=1 FL=1